MIFLNAGASSSSGVPLNPLLYVELWQMGQVERYRPRMTLNILHPSGMIYIITTPPHFPHLSSQQKKIKELAILSEFVKSSSSRKVNTGHLPCHLCQLASRCSTEKAALSSLPNAPIVNQQTRLLSSTVSPIRNPATRFEHSTQKFLLAVTRLHFKPQKLFHFVGQSLFFFDRNKVKIIIIIIIKTGQGRQLALYAILHLDSS